METKCQVMRHGVKSLRESWCRAECAPGRTQAAEGNGRRPIVCTRNRTDPLSGCAKNGDAPNAVQPAFEHGPHALHAVGGNIVRADVLPGSVIQALMVVPQHAAIGVVFVRVDRRAGFDRFLNDGRDVGMSPAGRTVNRPCD